MKKKINRPNLDSSANSSRSGSIQSRSQYSGRERGLDFSSLLIYIRKYNLTKVKMFQNKFGLDGENDKECDAIAERSRLSDIYEKKKDPDDGFLYITSSDLEYFCFKL